jgi:hypothetical protein
MKTREISDILPENYQGLGKDQREEFYDLIEIINKYTMEELIIHPRIQKDFKKTSLIRVFLKMP